MDYIVTKAASQKLRIISILKRSGFDTADLLVTLHSWIRSILEYEYQVWHSGLTLNLVHDIERVQIQAMFIICPHLSYWEAVDTFGLTTLDERREVQCKTLLTKLMNQAIFYIIFYPESKKTSTISEFSKNEKNIITRVNRTDRNFII